MIFEDVEEAPAAAQFELRTYQAQWNEAIAADRASGFTRVLVDAPGGCGKTTVFAALAAKEVANGGRVLVLENRDRLVDQTADRIRLETGLDVELERADDIASPTAKVVVASVQTLGRVGRLTGFPDDHFTLVIPDECFPGSTLVSGTPIALLQKGDLVDSFNHRTGLIEKRRVLNIWRNQPHQLVKVYAFGREIICTAGHPFFTQRGYVPAASLRSGDQIASVQGVREAPTTERALHAIASSDMHGVQRKAPWRDQNSAVQELRYSSELLRSVAVLHGPSGYTGESGLLLEEMRERSAQATSGSYCNETVGVESEAFQCSNEIEKSNAHAWRSRENDRLQQGEDIPLARRQWAAHEAADDTRGGARSFADGARNRNGGGEESISVAPAVLQGGHRSRRDEVGYRSGRREPQIEKVEVFGFQENQGLEFARVDGVEVLEQGSASGYREVCPDGFVYNLEVEGNNNYFAGGFLVHNCHHALANQWRRILCYFHYGAESLDPDWLIPNAGAYQSKATIVGFTATPDIGDKKNLGEIFQKFSVRYSYLDAVNEGWLVPPITESIPVKVDLRKFKTGRTPNGSDFKPADLTAALVPIIEELAQQVVNRASNRKTIAFVPSIECAKLLTHAIARLGLKAIFVSGECLDVDEKTEDFVNSGPGTVLCNAALYVEGADFPDIDCVAWFRATISRAFYIQGVYRGTRVLPGILNGCRTANERKDAIARSAKPNVLILDPLFVSDRIDLCDAYDLFTDKPEVKAKMKATGDLSAEGAETAERDFIAALSKAAKKAERKKARVINPLAWAVSMGDAKLASYRPETESERKPATEPQLNLLRQHHIDVTKITCAGLAHKMIGIILTRHTMKLATVGQLDFLHKLGAKEEDVATLKADEAAALIDRLKAERGWG